MRAYFQPGQPVYSWFRGLERVLTGWGASLVQGTAAHLDLVQEATDPTWSLLGRSRPQEVEDLLATDLPFLEWEIRAFPLTALLCNGRTVFDLVVQLLGARILATGTAKRLTWWVGTADLPRSPIAVSGWNIPLAQATGLTREGEVELGAVLREAVASRSGARS
jgi:hypothetical protein